MKLSKSKTNATLIASFLALTIAVTCVALPTVSAHTPPWKLPTWTYLAVSPNPIGVGQQVLVVFWSDKVPPTANGAYGDRWKFTVEVTKPDGSKETLGPITSDPVGGGWASYTPTVVGTYYFQAFFPEQILLGANPHPDPRNTYRNSPYVNDTYLASQSEKVPLTVQEEQLKAFEGTPLPTQYWTRPIYATNREWYTIAGNWLSDEDPRTLRHVANPYTTGPESAHIVWTKPLDFGGITGGPFGDISYYTGSAYEAKWGPPVIMQGRIYYNAPKSDQPFTGGLMCVDLRTGETIWWMNNTAISMGVIYDYESPNQHGQIPYLVYTSGGTMRFYDPFSGAWLYTITNVPSGTAAVGPNGEPLIYQWNLAAGWLALWNASAIPELLLSLMTGTDMWQWRPVGKTVNGTRGYSWNVTIPKDLPRFERDLVRVVYTDRVPEMILGSSGFIDRWTTADPFTLYAISLKPGQEGQVLWRKNYSPPIANSTIDPGYGMVVDPKNRVFCLPLRETMQWYGYSLDTGDRLWGPTPSQPAYDNYRMEPYSIAVNGTFYAGGYSGIVFAYDTKTGKLLWNASLGSCGLEGPYVYWPMGSGSGKTYADGKLYVTTYEHSTTMPLLRGWSIYCIDAVTGAHIWNITGLMGTIAIADGYAVSLDGMDNQIYCFGKGQTATTVSASPKVSVHGDSVLIEGTVTDQSPGAKDTPAISDNYMTEWMEYLYHQRSMPTNAKGVEVTLDTLDPNGNFVHIGTATSDTSGMFSYMFTPEVPGKYTIIATFEGSVSYFASYAETSIGVSEAPPTTPAPEYPQPIDYTLTIIGATVVLLVAIGLVGIWIKRK